MMMDDCKHAYLLVDKVEAAGGTEFWFVCSRCLDCRAFSLPVVKEPEFELLDIIQTDTGRVYVFWAGLSHFHFVRESDLLRVLKEQNSEMHDSITVSSQVGGVQ